MSKNAESFAITQNFALGFQQAHPLQFRTVEVHPFEASAGHTPLLPFCSALQLAGNLQQECQCPQGLEAKCRRGQQLGQTEPCCCVWGTEGRGWRGGDARLGSAAASSQVSAPSSVVPGWGHEPAYGEGKKTSLPSLVKDKAPGGVSRSLDVYLGDFFPI